MVWVLRYNLLFFFSVGFLETSCPSWWAILDWCFGVLFSWKSRLAFRTVGTSRRELGQRHCLPIFPQSSGLSDNRLFLFTFSPMMEKAINQLFSFVMWIKKTKYFRLYSSVLFPSGVLLIGLLLGCSFVGFCCCLRLLCYFCNWSFSLVCYGKHLLPDDTTLCLLSLPSAQQL